MQLAPSTSIFATLFRIHHPLGILGIERYQTKQTNKPTKNMNSISPPEPLSLSLPLLRTTAFHHHRRHLPCLLFLSHAASTISSASSSRSFLSSRRLLGSRRHFAVAATTTLMANSVPVRPLIHLINSIFYLGSIIYIYIYVIFLCFPYPG